MKSVSVNDSFIRYRVSFTIVLYYMSVAQKVMARIFFLASNKARNVRFSVIQI